MTNPLASVVNIRVGGRDYAAVAQPNCRTCQSPHRLDIERELVRGTSYANIARMLEDLEPGTMPHPDGQGIGHHVRAQHVPVHLAKQRGIIEGRAKELGLEIETAVDGQVDLITVNRMIIQNGFDRMQRGEIEASLMDVQAASRLLFQMEQASVGGTDERVWQDAMVVYMTVAMQFIPADRRTEFAKALRSNPVLQAIQAKIEATRQTNSVA